MLGLEGIRNLCLFWLCATLDTDSPMNNQPHVIDLGSVPADMGVEVEPHYALRTANEERVLANESVYPIIKYSERNCKTT